MKNANLLSRSLAALLVGVTVLFTGCDSSDKQPTAVEKPANAFFPLKVGDVPVSAQLAVTSSEMARGLMGRRDLGPDQGMLFLYERTQQMSFWMRNTPTPLDIGFFDRTGVLREIYPMYPFDERAITSRSRELMYALEVNQGWFAAKGLKPGARLDLIAVAKALRDRGFTGRGVEEVEAPAKP